MTDDSDTVLDRKPCCICKGDHTLREHIPEWRKGLSPEATTFFEETEESIERYRKWVKKQNKDISELYNDQKALRLILGKQREEIEKWRMAYEKARGVIIHLESHFYEIHEENDGQESHF